MSRKPFSPADLTPRPARSIISAMRTGLLLCLLLAGSLSASPTAVLTGRVRDAVTKEALVGASVIIEGTVYGNVTNLTGSYVIVMLPEMAGRATAAHVGYGDTSAGFVTASACTTHLDFTLRPSLSSLRTAAKKARARLRLPSRSETRVYERGGFDLGRTLIIRQGGDSVLVQSIGLQRLRPGQRPTRLGPCTTATMIPVDSFLVFWDSLDQLDFWQLKRGYSGSMKKDLPRGSLSVSVQQDSCGGTSKTVGFYAPGACPAEFRLVYELVKSMARFAQPVLHSYGDTIAPSKRR